MVQLICPETHEPLTFKAEHSEYVSPSGKKYPYHDGIIQFVENDAYAASFGLQWNVFRKTQLDSYTGTTISKDRLQRICGGDLNIFHGKDVLEVGCGAGRFSEIMLQYGAHLHSVDLSSAVYANYENTKLFANHLICQADLRKMPFPEASFDIVMCIGVIQHTPVPEETIRVLSKYVKPNGLLMIDHYSIHYPADRFFRKIIRNYLIKKNNPAYALKFCKTLVDVLWPVHRFTWKIRNIRGIGRLRDWWLKCSPVTDYHWGFPQLSDKLLYEWALLDTHDALTDYYKHLRSKEQIESCLLSLNMEIIKVQYAGNGVEALAKKI
jgi:SAM-dependent methyltransferase